MRNRRHLSEALGSKAHHPGAKVSAKSLRRWPRKFVAGVMRVLHAADRQPALGSITDRRRRRCGPEPPPPAAYRLCWPNDKPRVPSHRSRSGRPPPSGRSRDRSLIFDTHSGRCEQSSPQSREECQMSTIDPGPGDSMNFVVAPISEWPCYSPSILVVILLMASEAARRTNSSSSLRHSRRMGSAE